MHRYPKHSKSEVVNTADELEKSVKGLNPNHVIHMRSLPGANGQVPFPTDPESLDQAGRVPEKSPK